MAFASCEDIKKQTDPVVDGSGDVGNPGGEEPELPEGPVEEITLVRAYQTLYEQASGYDEFYIMLASGHIVYDEGNRLYRTEEDGYVMIVCLRAPSTDPSGPALSAGEYETGAGKKQFVWDADPVYNKLIYYSSEKGLFDLTPDKGKVTVSVSGLTTTLDFVFELADETMYRAIYEGELRFPGTEEPEFRPVDSRFVGGQAIWFGADAAYPHLGVVRLELWDAESVGDQGYIPGNLLKLAMYVPLQEGGFTGLPVGTYTFSDTDGPFAVVPGVDDGQNIPTGSYVSQSLNNHRSLAMLSSGTVTVAEDGRVTVDALTDEGVSVRGDIDSVTDMIDAAGSTSGGEEPGPEGPPYSTLTEDVEFTLSAAVAANVYDYGDYFENNTRNVIVQIIDEQLPAAMVMELVLPAGEKDSALPSGTLSVSTAVDDNHSEWSFLPGSKFSDNYIGTYYSTLVYNEQHQTYLWVDCGAVSSGTITITSETTEEATLYTFSVDLLDDAGTPHRIKGSWTGPVIFIG